MENTLPKYYLKKGNEKNSKTEEFYEIKNETSDFRAQNRILYEDICSITNI